MSEARSIWQAAQACALQPLAGGAVSVALPDLGRLFRVVSMCAETAVPCVRVELPDPAAGCGVEWSEIEVTATATATPDVPALLLGFEPGFELWQESHGLLEVGEILCGAVDGARLELATGGATALARQRYAGRVEADVWTIEATAPPMSKDDLERALRLARECEEEMPLTAPDVAAAERAVAATRAVLAGIDGLSVENDGVAVMAALDDEPDPNYHAVAASRVLREIFADGPWDFRELEAEDAELAELQAELQAMLAPPPVTAADGDVVLEGRASPFVAADLTACPYVDAADVDTHDATMRALGFEPLGDMACARMPDAVLRGYAGGDGASYGVAMAGNGLFVREFYTAFEDGSSIMTSSAPEAIVHCPGHRIECRPTGDADALFAAHRRRISGTSVPPVGIEPTLEGLAASMDAFLVRMGW